MINRTLRRIACGPLLALLLAVAQIGAVTHEIGHLADDLEQSHKTTTDKHAPQGKVCEQCIAFGQIGGAIGNPLAAPTLATFSVPPPSSGDVRFIVADAPTARSRGPPALL